MLCFLLLLVACATPPDAPTVDLVAGEAVTDLTLPDGISAEILPYSFDRPTQFALSEGDNALWVAQLNGGENAERGQVVRIDLATSEQTIVLDGLDKPTGLAVLDGYVWVATRDAIVRYAYEDDSAEIETIIDTLPNNGRSNGTLTVTSRGILYETSGNRRQSDSGKLWAIDPETFAIEELASGMKGAYAHVEDGFGRIWLTEIADGSVGGVTLPGEINLLSDGANYGWPTCYGRELAGPDCAGSTPAVTVLPVHSTPTSIAISPFAEDTLLVALWLTGEIVQIPYTINNGTASGDAVPFASGFKNPQHVLTLDDGSILVSDYTTGRIYRIVSD